jgi:hypothetical protein
MRKVRYQELTLAQAQMLVDQLEAARAMCHGFAAALSLVINEQEKFNIVGVRAKLQCMNADCAKVLDQVSDYYVEGDSNEDG